MCALLENFYLQAQLIEGNSVIDIPKNEARSKGIYIQIYTFKWIYEAISQSQIHDHVYSKYAEQSACTF
ncbi:hypothetical protein ACOSQ4_029939 [Xanthoceras sorbifolium]